MGTADRLTLSAASVWEAETTRAAGRLRVGPVAQAMLEDLVLVSEDQAVRQYGVPTAW